MDDENSDTKLKGELNEDNGSNIIPRFIINQSNLFNTISEIKSTVWEKEGVRVSN